MELRLSVYSEFVVFITFCHISMTQRDIHRYNANEVFIGIALHQETTFSVIPRTNNEVSLITCSCQTHCWLNVCKMCTASILMWKVITDCVHWTPLFLLIRLWKHSITQSVLIRPCRAIFFPMLFQLQFVHRRVQGWNYFDSNSFSLLSGSWAYTGF